MLKIKVTLTKFLKLRFLRLMLYWLERLLNQYVITKSDC
jgi:hypothetical protein